MADVDESKKSKKPIDIFNSPEQEVDRMEELETTILALKLEENNGKEYHNLKKPVDSPGNIFKSPTDRHQDDRIALLQDSILQISKSNHETNEIFKTNFSSLTQRYDDLLSLITSDKSTKVNFAGVETEDNNQTKNNKTRNKKKESTNEDDDFFFSKQLVEQTIKAVTPFDADKARLDGTVVKTFFNQLQRVFTCMDLSNSSRDEFKKVALLESKMADSATTITWFSSIMQSEEIPTSIQEWKIFMNDYFDVTSLVSRARSDFKNISMKHNEKASTFADRFKTARLQANHQDGIEMAERLVDSLNEQFTTLLFMDPDYRSLLRQDHYTSENIAKLLRNLQLQQDQISKKRIKGKQLDATASVKTVRTNPSSTPSTTTSPARSYNGRTMNGICHACGKPGHIKPNCPDLEGFLQNQAAKIEKQMKELSERKTNALSISTKTESVRDPPPDTTNNLVGNRKELVSGSNKSAVPEPQNNSIQLVTSIYSLKGIKQKKYVADILAMTIGKINSQEIPILLDIGANCNLIDPIIAHSLNLVLKPVEEPIEAEFANGSSYIMTHCTTFKLNIGSYTTGVDCLVCPIGKQIILGTPWYEEILATVDVRSQLFSFKERAWPGASFFAPQEFTFPLLTKKEIIKWQIQNGASIKTQKKTLDQTHIQNKQTSSHIAMIKGKELERIKKSCLIYNVTYRHLKNDQDKEVPDFEVQHPKMDPDATAHTPEAMSMLSPAAVEIVQQYSSIFDPPTKLPPERPEDIIINLKEGASPPKYGGCPD
jgi:DNA-binding transcriptional MerR regulator